jgi:hypothetical protein
MSDYNLDELAEELSEFAAPVKAVSRSPREERIIAGFEDIQRFVDTHGRPPRHGEEGDIFERLYAVRLDRLRALPEARELLTPLDRQGLLDASAAGAATEEISLDDLSAELGEIVPENDVRVLRHVRPYEERQAAEEVASRTKCEDFEQFAPIFARIESDLAAGIREGRRFRSGSVYEVGDAFILGGQIAYIAEKGPEFPGGNGQVDARLRVIYSNETESNLLLRSLQRALQKDENGRRIVDVTVPNLFSGEWEEDDVSSGTIYVLRSHSQHPFIAEHRELIHKIGVTGGSIETRISQASKDATYLLADVEVVATYKLASVNRTKLEALLHRIFAPAQLDLTIHDRFGNPVQPREWFLVPLHVIDDVVQRILDGTVTNVTYDPVSARLVESS